MNRRQGGFNLIELMIVVAIIAILAKFSLDTYTRYMASARVSEAEGYLTSLAQREQQYLLDNRTYADTATITGVDGIPLDVIPNYTINVTLSAAGVVPPTFQIDAVPKATGTVAKFGQAKYNQTLTIKSDGTKTSSNAAAYALW
jgi:type IV pilus assembly protein PilE